MLWLTERSWMMKPLPVRVGIMLSERNSELEIQKTTDMLFAELQIEARQKDYIGKEERLIYPKLRLGQLLICNKVLSKYK